MKDNFSAQAGEYATFRPSYSGELILYIRSLVANRRNAWDCATGNGQMARALAGHFEKVYATDISQAQLDHAVKKENIIYSLQPAEKTAFPDQFFDLIVVAQAVHWFDFDPFYREVHRVLKPDGAFVVTGYYLPRISAAVDAVVDHLYLHLLGPYWDSERKLIDEYYRTIPFPFAETETPQLHQSLTWQLSELTGYLQTWSAVMHYKRQHGSNPIDLISGQLKDSWGTPVTREVTFPVLLRAGYMP